MRIILILITLALIACQADPKPEEISQIVGQVISECLQTANEICQQIPQDADKNMRVGEVEIIDSRSAKLEWQWEWGQELRQKYEITVLYEQESWQPGDVKLIEQVRREEEVVEIPPEVKVRFDVNLLTDAAYVVQFVSKVKQIIVKKKWINEKTKTKKLYYLP